MTDKPMTVDQMISHIVKNTGEKGYLGISFNYPRHLFQSIKDTFPCDHDEDCEEGEGYESLEDYKKCMENNIVWDVSWYPSNSVGSYKTFGSTLEKALGLMFKICIEETGNGAEYD